VDAFPDGRSRVQITAMNPAISPESRAFIVEVRVPNRDAALKPGMFAVATIDQGAPSGAMLVPRAPSSKTSTPTPSGSRDRPPTARRLRVVQLAAASGARSC
jgi:membrane fusion protein, multidrug efflux system